MLYEMLKKTKLFDEEGKASADDKLMFKEIQELNDERKRIDDHEEQHAVRKDPKKSLNRLTVFVDEVHDILMTLNIKQIMRNYWDIIEEKGQSLGDLCKNIAIIKLIPPSLLPKDIRLIFEHETPTTPRSPKK